MTRNKLEKMAKAAKIFDLYGQQAKQRTTFLLSEKEIKRFQDFLEALEKFAGLVAAHEREECAKVLEDFEQFGDTRDCIAAIRARGQE